MYFVSSSFVGTFTNNYTPPAPVTVLSKYKWNVKLYHRSGGLKKEYLFGQADSAIEGFEFENNRNGSGAGRIKLAYIDFPIDADDYVEIFYNGVKTYRGIVDATPDIEGGEIELIPQWKRFEELLYNGSFVAQTAAQILQTVIEAVDASSLITWNPAYVDTGSTEVFTKTYSYETVKKIIDDVLSELDDRYCGVTPDNIFYVRELENTVSSDLFYSSEVGYSEIKFETDYSGIKATRYQVLKKVSGSGETTRIGEVGYGGSYPVLPIENLFRMKEQKITVSEVLSDAEALDYAYARLKSFKATQNITVSDINLDRFVPIVGKYIRIMNKEITQLTTIVDCESVTGWNGASLDNADYVEGAASVYFNGSAVNDGITYSFSKQMRYIRMSKIGFMVKCHEAGRKLSVRITTGTNHKQYSASYGICGMGEAGSGDTIARDEQSESFVTNTIYIPNADVWHFIEFNITDPIVKFEMYFNTAPSATCKVNVDRIQVMRPFRKQYTDNIVQVNYSVNKNGENVTMKMNSYDPMANDNVFYLENKINALETALEDA